MKIKRILSLLLCVCLLLAAFPPAFTAFAEDEIGGSDILTGETGETGGIGNWEDIADVEEPYVDSNTIYDLENEMDAVLEPEETPPPDNPDLGDEESEIYDNYSYDAENAAQLAGAEYVLDELIVKFKEPWQVPGKEKQLQHEIEKVEKVGFVESLDAYVVKADDLGKNPNAVLNRFKNNKYVEYIEPNYILKTDLVPTDPGYPRQYAVLAAINAPEGWDIIMGGSEPTVAVVDSGVAPHPDLPPLLPGYSAVAGLSPNNDKLGHGTGVAGIIGAIGNNNIGGAGINWNASILPVKVDDANGTMSVANVAKGVIWAADNGAKIINLSVGTVSDSVTLKNAIDYAYSKGCAIFAATGNENKPSVCYPARYSDVMAVGGSANGTARAAISNYGTGMGVVAITSYYTTTTSGGNTNMSGTSFSTPQATGLASLVWALNPSLSNDQIYRLIEQGAKTIGDGYNEQTGYGMIDIGNTLRLAGGTAATEPTAEPALEPTAEPSPEPTLEHPLADLPSNSKSFILEAATGNRNNYNGSVGYEFECLVDMTVSHIGRPLNGEMNFSHAVYIWEVKTTALLAKAEVKSDSPPDTFGFKVAQLDRAITLKAGERYRIVSAETTGGDKWYDIEQAYELKPNADCRITTPVYTDEGTHASYPRNSYSLGGIKGYTGVTFYYETASAVPPEPEQLPPETPQEVRTPPVITLTGFTELALEYGQLYNEMGYTAVDCKGIDLTGAVKVTNTIDIWKAGLYTITYEVTDSDGLAARATRTVTVNPQPPVPPPPQAPKITIIGSNPIVLHLTSGTSYTEQSARAIDSDGTDISGLVKISGSVNRNAAGVYTLTYSVTSPVTGLTATTTRNVRIVAPTEKRDPRTKYGLSGQAKQGGKVTHTGIVSGAVGFMDLKVSSIDKNMTITVELIDTTTKKAIVTDTFTSAGTKQYKINQSKYELVVTVDKANGNSKYAIDLLMPETEVLYSFADEEVPLASFSGPPKVAPVGSNPIILHLGGTAYMEQGARAVDYDDEDISDRVEIIGKPDTSVAGTYFVTYRVTGDLGLEAEAVREVRVLAPSEEGIFEDEEIPLGSIQIADGICNYIVVSGDSLWHIARKQYGDGARWREIYDMNKDLIGNDPGRIYVGQVLTIKAV